MILTRLRRSKHRASLQNSEKLPEGVRLVALSRMIRWIGWGFGESLIPLFIFYFSSTFAEAGLLRAVLEIVSLLTLPLIGSWADRFPAKWLIVSALVLYPLVGVSYFLAGVFGAAIFIVVARGLNGFLWELENIGIATYYRRMAKSGIISTSFGYLETLSTLGWILAALAGIFLVPHVPIHVLLLAITPFAILALLIALKAPKDEFSGKRDEMRGFRSFYHSLAEWQAWDAHLWLLGTLVVFSGLIEALMWFFIPIEAYINGAQPSLVILLSVLAAVPALLGYFFGKIADAGNKYRLIAGGLLGIMLVMVGLASFPGYGPMLFASFILGCILEFFGVIQSGLITSLGPVETYGRRGSAFESLAVLGDLAAPLILGISLDILGFSNVAFALAAVSLVLCLSYVTMKARA
jgi:MFS family permease